IGTAPRLDRRGRRSGALLRPARRAPAARAVGRAGTGGRTEPARAHPPPAPAAPVPGGGRRPGPAHGRGGAGRAPPRRTAGAVVPVRRTVRRPGAVAGPGTRPVPDRAPGRGLAAAVRRGDPALPALRAGPVGTAQHAVDAGTPAVPHRGGPLLPGGTAHRG